MAHAARGEFVQFLDSDDLFLPNKFTDQIAGLRGDPAADISYGKTYTCQRGVRESTPAQSTGERHRQLFPALLAGPIWPTLTPMYRREFLVKAGPWRAARQLEDWRYDAQAAVLGVKLNYVDTYMAEVNNHDEGRLCYLWQTDRRAMVERIEAYEIVFDLAQKPGVRLDSPEMQQYVRSLFWMARNAGAYGLPERARRLLDLGRDIDHRF